jgi:hypothetical protein
MTATDPAPLPRIVDLTGLPEPVVERVHRIVREAREVVGEPSPAQQLTPVFDVPPPTLSLEEKRRALDEMAAMSSGQSLPLDWSRADLYEDHD